MTVKQQSGRVLFSEKWSQHESGNAKCTNCGVTDYPQKHECGGLVHFTAVSGDTGLCFIKIYGFEICDTCDYQKDETCVFTDQ